MNSAEAIGRLEDYPGTTRVDRNHDWLGSVKVPHDVAGDKLALLAYLDDNPELELMDSYWLLPNGTFLKVEAQDFSMAHWESAAYALERYVVDNDGLENAFLDFKQLTGAAHMTYFVAGGEPMVDFPRVPTMEQIMALADAEQAIGDPIMWTVSRRDKKVVSDGIGTGELLLADPAQVRRGLEGARISPLLAFR
jgi:hypothetical protein